MLTKTGLIFRIYDLRENAIFAVVGAEAIFSIACATSFNRCS